MFKGISEKFKEKLERFNRETEFFCFNCSDLELGDYENEGEGVYYKTYRKYYLYSSELKQKLNRIIQEHNKSGEKIPALRSVFFNRVPPYESALRTLSNSFNWWFIFSKDSIYQMAKRGVQQGKGSFLVYDGEGKMQLTTTLPNFFLGAMNREDPLIRRLQDKISQLRSSVISEVKQSIIETKIDNSDLEINYLELLPDNCQCEVDVNPDASLKNTSLWKDHVDNCLGRKEEEFADFKEQMLAQIQQSKISFSNFVSSTISEIETLFREKGVKEDSFYLDRVWKEYLRLFSSKKQVEDFKDSLIQHIDRQAELNAKNLRRQEEATKITEENAREEAFRQAQAQAEEEAEKMRRQARAEAESLREKQNKKRQEETRKRTQQEQKESQQQEEKEKQRKLQEEELKNQHEEKLKRRRRDPNSKLNVNEVREEVKETLNQELLTNHLQNSDLPEEFWNWTEKLKELKSEEEIYLYQDFILDSVAKIVEKKKVYNDQEQPKSSSWLDNLLVWGGIFSLSLFLFFFLKKLSKK